MQFVQLELPLLQDRPSSVFTQQSLSEFRAGTVTLPTQLSDWKHWQLPVCGL